MRTYLHLNLYSRIYYIYIGIPTPSKLFSFTTEDLKSDTISKYAILFDKVVQLRYVIYRLITLSTKDDKRSIKFQVLKEDEEIKLIDFISRDFNDDYYADGFPAKRSESLNYNVQLEISQW